MQDRPYQTKCLELIKKNYDDSVYQQLIKMATGTGKTRVFSRLPDYMRWSKRMMVMVHREELAEQAAASLRHHNPDRSVGIEMGANEAGHADIVVASPQTLGLKGSTRVERFLPEDFDGVVVDEAHHSVAETYMRVFDHFGLLSEENEKLLLGVTATPNRADGKGMNKVYRKISFEYSIRDGINDGWLADLRGKRVATEVLLDEVKKVGDDFNQAQLAEEVNQYKHNKLVAEQWGAHVGQGKGIVFGVDIQHCKDLATVFRSLGLVAEAIWGSDEERREKLARHRSGNTRVLINCQLLTEGYDDWEVMCVGINAPTISETKYIQEVGRGTRIEPGIGNLKEALSKGLEVRKKDCLVLDFVGNSEKHSLVTLASLFGMGPNTDLKGKKLTEVMKEVEDAVKHNPDIDLSKLQDIDGLPALVAEADLFRVSFPPEVVQVSDLQWHRTGIDQYILLMVNDEGVSIKRDMLDNWNIMGSCHGALIQGSKPTFEEAIREADWYVNMLGGKGLKTLLRRTAKWHNDEITPGQRKMCKWLGIPVPAGMTKGQAAQKITEYKSKKKAAA